MKRICISTATMTPLPVQGCCAGIWLYDIPFSQTEPVEITFTSHTQDAMFNTTATGKTVICLDPGGSSGSIRSEWE